MIPGELFRTVPLFHAVKHPDGSLTEENIMNAIVDETTSTEGLYILEMGPLDCFTSFTLSAAEWVGRHEEGPEAAAALLIDACFTVAKHPLWDGVQRSYSPRVAFNAQTDSLYFIFKLDNNGTTFLVGWHLPQGLEGDLYFVPDGESKPMPVAKSEIPLIDSRHSGNAT